MSVQEVLASLDLGSSVAEHDAALERYFVETQTFRALVNDKGDVVAGDKGTGKTALYRILHERFRQLPELKGIEVIPAFNPAGTPVFQRLGEGAVLSEQAYIGVWKAYFLALAGNWILELAAGDFTEDMVALDGILTRSGLRVSDDSPQTVFSQLVNRVKKILRTPSLIEATATATPDGLPIIGARLEFAEDEDSATEFTRHDEALALLDRILDWSDFTLWLVLDRLDEAFQGRPDLEKPALRALFRTYLDLLGYSRFKLKLFVRNDLFARIIGGGFVNLTHVNARRIDIRWDQEDLYSLLHKRLTENEDFIRRLAPPSLSADDVFQSVFPGQVDAGKRKPTTWTWMMGRIRDGNDVRPPRNLIDLVLKARSAQLRKEERAPRDHAKGQPLIESDSLKRGLDALSDERVQDTLIAEAGEHAPVIELFGGSKAEHNETSLRDLLGNTYFEQVKMLVSIGFLEQVGSTFKVPILYRGGLGITQGKAFSSADESVTDEDEE